MTLKSFLEKYHAASTVKIYLFEINHFINYLGEEKAATAQYKDIIDYIHFLRKQYDNSSTINRILQSIKKYYFFLIETGNREDHPCQSLRIKLQNSAIQVQDLLSKEELQLLLKRKERYKILKLRNQVIMTLLVYQALRLQEMTQIKIKDLNLENGEIQIKETSKTNARILPLKPEQIMLFYRYLNQTRPQLLKGKSSPVFIITQKGSAEKGEGIHYLVEAFRPLFPYKKLSPTTIRQSVIANKLKEGKDLRIVQVFAGHKKPSATEKYRQNDLEALKIAVNRHHPLK